MNKLLWIGGPVLAIFLIIGVRWLSAAVKTQERQARARVEIEKSQRQLAEGHTEKGRREYVLEVIGLGVTFENFRQGRIWDVLKAVLVKIVGA